MNNMEEYVGEPLLTESIDCFLAIDNPDTMGYHNHGRQVIINQAPFYQPSSVLVYQVIIDRWTNLIEIYHNDVYLFEGCKF